MSGRLLILGDIHGCADELRALLDRLAPGADDEVLSVGDLVAKGPDAAGVLDLVAGLPRFQAVRGNHEARWLDAAAGRPPEDWPPEWTLLGPRGPEYLARIAAWPLWLDRGEVAVVHAGLRPGRPLSQQSAADLLGLKRLEDGRPWYEAYEGPPKVVFGHWPREEPLLRPWAVGLDTGCVYGGRLSAYVWPQDRVESVPARRAYAQRGGRT